MARMNHRAAGVFPLVACLVTLAAYAGSATAASSSTAAVKSATINGSFSATVVQGPEAGKSWAGQLKLTGTPKGYLTGTLSTANGSIHATGQLRGQLIGLSLAIGPKRTISGTGIVGYDPATKQNTIGGTFSGPSDRSIGVWALQLVDTATGYGGCTQGLPLGRPGLCYIVV